MIVAFANPAVAALQQATHTLPIVLVQVSDPVGSKFVASLAHPGGNITGLQNFEPEIGGKWLEVLKQIAPGLRRAIVVHSPEVAANVEILHSAQAASTTLDVSVAAAGVHNLAEIEQALAALAQQPNGGVIVAPSPLTLANRGPITASAARLGVPAIYPFRFFAAAGGLASYGFDPIDQWRGAASYVDRILKGEKPSDLPVQAPVKYALVINLKAAKALGLTIPEIFPLARRRGDRMSVLCCSA